MSFEQPQSKSEGYGLQEGWEVVELVAELPIFPVEIMGGLISDAFETNS